MVSTFRVIYQESLSYSFTSYSSPQKKRRDIPSYRDLSASRNRLYSSRHHYVSFGIPFGIGSSSLFYPTDEHYVSRSAPVLITSSFKIFQSILLRIFKGVTLLGLTHKSVNKLVCKRINPTRGNCRHWHILPASSSPLQH